MAHPVPPAQMLSRTASVDPARPPDTNSRASGNAARASCVMSVPGTYSKVPASSTSPRLVSYSSRTENVTSRRLAADTSVLGAEKISSPAVSTHESNGDSGSAESGARLAVEHLYHWLIAVLGEEGGGQRVDVFRDGLFP
eukprot:scaffold3507_cov185-Pinguiococcus_pyrenoidosus.AAC.1